MKKSFSAPLWLLLGVGVFQLVTFFVYLSYLSRVSHTYGHLNAPRVGWWRVFMWPVILFTEAFVYWRMRWRNRYPGISWAHTGLFAFAFFANIILSLLQLAHYPVGSILASRGTGNGLSQQEQLFWVLVVLAHAVFIWLLILCYRKREEVKDEESEGENILDDVAL
jgi:uncharacterized membrane protein